jgi:hypothetical protein
VGGRGRFVVLDNNFTLEFLLSDTSNKPVVCNCPIQVYLVGDLKFYAQMSAREDISSALCMWCMLHSSEWKTFGENKDSILEPVPGENKEQSSEGAKGEKGRSIRAHLELH